MTDKISLTDLANLQNETTAVNAINDNNAAITTAFDNTLSRDGTSPNQMSASLDMNSNRILNLPTPISDAEPARLVDVGPPYDVYTSAAAAALAGAATATAEANAAVAQAVIATTEAGIATTQATSATSSASSASSSATAAAASAATATTLQVSTVSGTTYTLQSTDTGKLILFTNSSAVTVTCPNNLSIGFNVCLEQAGAGVITIVAASGAVFDYDIPASTSTGRQYGIIALAVQTNAGGAAANYIVIGRVPTAEELAAAYAAMAVLTVQDLSGTTYTLLPTDIGNLLRFTSNSSVTVTAPNSLPRGFNCLIEQAGTGTITVSAAAGATLENADGSYATTAQYSLLCLLVRANATSTTAAYVLTGGVYSAFSYGTGLTQSGSTVSVDTTVIQLLNNTYVAKTSTYAILTTDDTVNCTTGTFTVTLPTAVGVTGKKYTIKNSGTGVITVATTSSQTIDGSTTAIISTQYVSLTVMSNGANWMVI